MKILDPKTHGFLDYALALAFLIAPAVFDFSERATTLAYAIGVVYIGASLITRYPLGILKWIPFPVHGAVETLMAVGFILAPWLFGFSEDAAARNFYVVAGVGVLAVVFLTDYRGRGTAEADSRRVSHA